MSMVPADLGMGEAGMPAVQAPQMSAAQVKEKWATGTRAVRQERNQAAVNRMFLQNKHWVHYNRVTERLEELHRDPNRVRATVAKIGPDSRTLIAKLMRRPLTFDVPPATPDDAAIKGSRLAESVLVETSRRQNWERLRADHAWQTWEGGVAGVAVDWNRQAGTPLGQDEQGRLIATGDVELSIVSLHEIATEPGTRSLEDAYWWIKGQAHPPEWVQNRYQLDKKPEADARISDYLYRVGEQREAEPMTLVLHYYCRPSPSMPQGLVGTVVGDRFVDGPYPWPFPFTGKLNITVATVMPLHGRWLGHTPVTDAVPVQALINASWSSIVEHMKLAGNARMWIPSGSLEEDQVLSDLSGELVEFNPIPGAPNPEWKSPPVMPDWWIRQPEMLGSAMDDILGLHAISRGDSPTGIESGVALSILSENDDTPVGAFAKELGECWGRAASLVLEMYAAYVTETRASMVHLPGGVAEVMDWTGQDLMGQTQALVPLDSVLPRSRAAQAAYALQLYDRQIIKAPTELAKVADLPDQDDLLDGISPDTARAQRENAKLTSGRVRMVQPFDDHIVHMNVHHSYMKSERYELLPPEAQDLFRLHIQAHETMAAEQAGSMARDASLNPMLPQLPTTYSKPVDPAMLAQSVPMSPMVGPQMPAGDPTDSPADMKEDSAEGETAAQEESPDKE